MRRSTSYDAERKKVAAHRGRIRAASGEDLKASIPHDEEQWLAIIRSDCRRLRRWRREGILVDLGPRRVRLVVSRPSSPA